ncbi:MAG: hypothetical protein ACF8PN_04585 [Phycisphaerales bacterium]
MIAGARMTQAEPAFIMVELDPPGGVDGVASGTSLRINNAGDVLATYQVGSTTHVYLWDQNDFTWYRLENGGAPVNDAVAVAFNSIQQVVGTYFDGVDDVAFLWDRHDATPFQTFGSNREPTDINEEEKIVGWQNNSAPFGWRIDDQMIQTLKVPAGWDANCAVAINPTLTPGLDERIPGQAEKLNAPNAGMYGCVWRNGTFNMLTIDGLPAAVNDDGLVVGVTDNAFNPDTGAVWEPDGAGGWTWYDLGAELHPVDVNSSSEIAVARSIVAWYGGAVDPYHIVPVESFIHVPVQIDSGTWSIRGINDDGQMVAWAERFDTPSNTPTVVKIVPRDDDNDGTPDYREIEAGLESDSDGDWIPDDVEQMRVGLFGAGKAAHNNGAMTVANVQALRMHSDYDEIEMILCNTVHPEIGPACEWARNLFNGVGVEHDNEIIFMTRNPHPTDSGHDVIPVGTERDEKLDDMREFVRRFAYNIDAVQVGNEIYRGAGDMVIDSNALGLGACQGYVGEWSAIAGTECFEEATAAILVWLTDQTAAVREGSALAGRPLRVIGPALTNGMVTDGANGDLGSWGNGGTADAPAKSAYAVQQLILWANAHCVPLDIHLHYNHWATHIYGPVEDIMNQGNPEWDVPNDMVSLEWGPEPKLGSGDWYQEHLETIRAYYSVGTTLANWNAELEEWLMDDQIDDALWCSELLDLLNSYQFHYACYGHVAQFGDSVTPNHFDLASIVPTAMVGANELTRHTPYYENAAANFVITSGWDPHPNPVSDNCPSCP